MCSDKPAPRFTCGDLFLKNERTPRKKKKQLKKVMASFKKMCREAGHVLFVNRPLLLHSVQNVEATMKLNVIVEDASVGTFDPTVLKDLKDQIGIVDLSESDMDVCRAARIQVEKSLWIK